MKIEAYWKGLLILNKFLYLKACHLHIPNSSIKFVFSNNVHLHSK